MNTFLLIYITVVVIFIGFAIYMFRRLNRISKFRLELINKIRLQSQRDIQVDKNWTWRYDKLHKVSFTEMANKFWKPINSFYSDYSFIHPHEELIADKTKEAT